MASRRAVRSAATILVLAGVLAACGGPAPAAAPSATGIPEALTPLSVAAQRLPAGPTAPVAATVAGMDSFAGRLAAAAAEPGRNFVFSPLSIEYAFAMLDAGARGHTAAQIEKTLGLPPDFAEAFDALTQQLVGSALATPSPTADPGAGPRPAVLHIANGVFSRRGYPYEQAFLRTLAERYGAQVDALDLGDQQGALSAINQWASGHTAGRIPAILNRLDEPARLVLVNAVYLKADWVRAFEPAGDRDFAVAAGSPAPVPMIERTDTLGYAGGPGWRAVTLPYFGGRLAMRVILPTGATAPRSLLNAGVLAASGRTTPTEVHVTMPKWDFATDLDLRQLLPKLGMSDVFDAAADLSGITTAERLFVTQAVHCANVTVDEVGTEAAAATAVVAAPAAARVSTTPPVEFTVDRPFAFEIVDTQTAAPLFLGTVSDPAATQ